MCVPSLTVLSVLSLVLTGCAISPTASPSLEQGLGIRGIVHGGQQPLVGAHVYLFAANTTGNAGSGIPGSALNASKPLLTAATGFSDTLGNYVPTDANGSWAITGDYTCTANQQVYLYVLGGDSGAGNNSAIGLLAALGACPTVGYFPANTFVWINEVSTIATAYALAGFATDATHISSSGTPLAQQDIATAFANITNLENLSTGSALFTTPAGNGTVPSDVIDTLADILAVCINSSSATSTECSNLFGFALNNASPTPAAPTDTATAAINIAHNPANNVASLFGLVPGIAAPFSGLRVAPNDFTVAINYTASLGAEPNDIAIDAAGNAWIADSANNRIVELSPLGAVMSGSGYIAGGDILFPWVIAFDLNGNAWIANNIDPSSTVTELTSTGALALGTGNFTGGGLSIPTGLAVDSNNNVWIGNYFSASVTEISGGAIVSGANGYPVPQTLGLAIDTGNHPWIATTGSLLFEELSSAGAIINSAAGRGTSGIDSPRNIAIDSFGDVWIVDPYTTNVIEESSAGGIPPLSGYFGYAQGSFAGPTGIAIDGANNVWVSDYEGSKIVELSNSGTVLSGANGFTSHPTTSYPFSVALDGSGNLWTISFGSLNIVEFIGLSAPVVTPLVYGVKTNALGTRP